MTGEKIEEFSMESGEHVCYVQSSVLFISHLLVDKVDTSCRVDVT